MYESHVPRHGKPAVLSSLKDAEGRHAFTAHQLLKRALKQEVVILDLRLDKISSLRSSPVKMAQEH